MMDREVKFQLSLFQSPDWPIQFAAPGWPSVGHQATPSDPITYYTTLSQVYQATSAYEGTIPPFVGYYGEDARLSLMIAMQRGFAGAQAAYDYLNPIEAQQVYLHGVSDLAWRAGWAIQKL
jgi:hypothetical protein